MFEINLYQSLLLYFRNDHYIIGAILLLCGSIISNIILSNKKNIQIKYLGYNLLYKLIIFNLIIFFILNCLEYIFLFPNTKNISLIEFTSILLFLNNFYSWIYFTNEFSLISNIWIISLIFQLAFFTFFLNLFIKDLKIYNIVIFLFLILTATFYFTISYRYRSFTTYFPLTRFWEFCLGVLIYNVFIFGNFKKIKINYFTKIKFNFFKNNMFLIFFLIIINFLFINVINQIEKNFDIIKIDNYIKNFKCYNLSSYIKDKSCSFNSKIKNNKEEPVNIYIFGDIDIKSISNSLIINRKKYNYNVIPTLNYLCWYLPDENVFFKKESLYKYCFKNYLSVIRKHQNKNLTKGKSVFIFGGNFEFYISSMQKRFSNSFSIINSSVSKNISELSKNNKVFIIYPFPKPGKEKLQSFSDEIKKNKLYTSKRLHNHKFNEYLVIDYNQYRKKNENSFKIFDAIEDHENIFKIYPSDFICTKQSKCSLFIEKNLFTKDNIPSQYFGDIISDKIFQVINSKNIK